MRSCLQIFTPLSYEFIDLLVLFRKLAELVTEFRRLTPSFNFNFSSQSLELINVSGTHLLFDSK